MSKKKQDRNEKPVQEAAGEVKPETEAAVTEPEAPEKEAEAAKAPAEPTELEKALKALPGEQEKVYLFCRTQDAEYLKAKQVKIIPLGIPDSNTEEVRKVYGENGYMTVMFMGLLNSTKGEGYVLDAVNLLNKSGRDVRFVFAGKFESEEYRDEFFAKVKEYGLQDKVEYKGIVTGEDKKQMFLGADVFCFPSFFSSESFGIVLLEGMMYQMPLIASRWRGIQSVVEEGRNGYLVDIKNSEQIAEALTKLYDDRTLLENMAKESRQMFVEKYELSKYLANMEKAMCEI